MAPTAGRVAPPETGRRRLAEEQRHEPTRRASVIAAIAITLGTLVAVLGLLGLLRPATLIGLVEAAWRPGWGPHAVAAVRVLMGGTLLAAGPESRFPATLAVLGCIAIIGGLAVPAMGRERQRAMLGWWKRRHATFLRAWSLAAVAFGGFVVFACW